MVCAKCTERKQVHGSRCTHMPQVLKREQCISCQFQQYGFSFCSTKDQGNRELGLPQAVEQDLVSFQAGFTQMLEDLGSTRTQ